MTESNSIRAGSVESDAEHQQHRRPTVVGSPGASSPDAGCWQDIARGATALDLSPATARRYQSVFSAGGADALTELGDVGPRPRLTADGLARLIEAIRQSPHKVGLVAECWTNLLVQRYIERELQISVSARSVPLPRSA
ncbi:helix-turn-helix domain-containing protein [Paraburkholderia sp. J76]|uniref:helix-turn-helix domain-containing protein n=1 Tax=Paraburkholderia sp. J76 TaxID=2805439 RepID=UPI002ABD3815|nr:helix-turn-helix domain-containing protein [Paraburkholderia sp. J76]